MKKLKKLTALLTAIGMVAAMSACGSNTARLSAKGRPTGACAYSGHTRARSKRYCDKI